MVSVPPEDVSDTKITVTSTATALYDLINTASSKKSAQRYYDGLFLDALMIQPEADVRILYNADPTASLGELLSAGVKYYLPNIEPFGMRLIRVGGSDASVNLAFYRAERGESPTAVAFDVTVEATLTSSDVTYTSNIATDSGDANIEYIGKAVPGTATSAASWQIRKLDSTTGTVMTWADGNNDFDNIWDNRESLSYS